MAKLTRTQLDNKIKEFFLDKVMKFLESLGEEILRTGSNEIALPVVDADGNEKWLVLTFKVPTGSRTDGEPYDGYSVAEDYQMKQTEKAQKKAEKEAKAAKDKAKREAAEKAKAEAK